MLVEEGVDLALGNRATTHELPNGQYEVTLANGTKITADAILDTTTKGSATTGFLPAECLNEEQEVKVTSNLRFKADIPNAESHYAVGDVIEWSGIKRAGGAMVMGQLAASNIYASILQSEDSSHNFVPGELPFYENVIGLAVGKQCLTYDKTNGIKFGVKLMQDYFQGDLGWAANLRYLRLTDAVEDVAQELEKIAITEVIREVDAAAA